jgi:hypothetical protein
MGGVLKKYKKQMMYNKNKGGVNKKCIKKKK